MINYRNNKPIGSAAAAAAIPAEDEATETDTAETMDFAHIDDFLASLDTDEMEYLREALIKKGGEEEDGDQLIPFDDSEEAAMKEPGREVGAVEEE